MPNKSAEKAVVDPAQPRVTDNVPMVPFKVIETGIPFFLDKECKQQAEGASIAIIQALDPDDEIQELDIVPTTKTYQKSSYVTLAFDNKRIWEECYFRDPASKEVRRAWRIHVNFIGEVISEESVRREKARLNDLEAQVQQKIQQIAAKSAIGVDTVPLN